MLYMINNFFLEKSGLLIAQRLWKVCSQYIGVLVVYKTSSVIIFVSAYTGILLVLAGILKMIQHDFVIGFPLMWSGIIYLYVNGLFARLLQYLLDKSTQ